MGSVLYRTRAFSVWKMFLTMITGDLLPLRTSKTRMFFVVCFSIFRTAALFCDGELVSVVLRGKPEKGTYKID